MSSDSARRRRRWFATIAVIGSTTLALVAGEFTAYAWERASRDDFLGYADTWRTGGLGPGGYLKEGFEGTVAGEVGGVRWKNNAQGLRYDRELDTPTPDGVVRVLVLGDSFAAGYRVDQEATYASRLEQSLRADGIDAEVPIAVIEEPVTGLYWLDRHGIDFDPDLVILGLCVGNDIAQAYLALDPRGTHSLVIDGTGVAIDPQQPADPLGFHHGLERHELPAGALVADPPARLPRSKMPRLVELVVGSPRRAVRAFYGRESPHKLFDAYNGLGMCLREPPAEIDAAYERLSAALDGYRVWCGARGIEFALLVSAQPYQVHPEDWEVVVASYGLRPEAFDLDAPNRRIAELCARRGIPCLDPTRVMRDRHRKSGIDYFHAGGDMHWNAAGHAAAARAIAPRVRELVVE